MIGDPTLFSRTDLVESAWRIAQPILESWSATKPDEFPNYPAGSWGPQAAFDLLKRDGHQWLEVINRAVLERVPLFQHGDAVFLQNLSMMLRPVVYSPGEYVFKVDEPGNEMYFICRGQVEALNKAGKVLTTIGEGGYFGEVSLMFSKPRTASIRAATSCNLFVLDGSDFNRVVKTHPDIAKSLDDAAQKYLKGQQE